MKKFKIGKSYRVKKEFQNEFIFSQTWKDKAKDSIFTVTSLSDNGNVVGNDNLFIALYDERVYCERVRVMNCVFIVLI